MGFTLRDETFLEQPFLRLFKGMIKNRKLVDRIFDIYSGPEIQDQGFDNWYSINFDDGSKIQVCASRLAPEELTTGLAILYGYGFVKPNYLLPIFASAAHSRTDEFARKLAAEIWDTRIHIDWMRNYCGRAGHNESKDLEFCILVADGKKDEAIEIHRVAYQQNKDTPHNMTKNEFVRQMLNPDELLFEVFDDQASVAGRYFRKKNIMRESHNKTQDKLTAQGVMLYLGNTIVWWRKEFFKDFAVSENTQKNVWGYWESSNAKFCEYWVRSFGEFNENWHPPVD